MKKLALLFLSVITLFCLSSCSDSAESSVDNSPPDYDDGYNEGYEDGMTAAREDNIFLQDAFEEIRNAGLLNSSFIDAVSSVYKPAGYLGNYVLQAGVVHSADCSLINIHSTDFVSGYDSIPEGYETCQQCIDNTN